MCRTGGKTLNQRHTHCARSSTIRARGSLGSQGPRGGHVPQQLLRVGSETDPTAAPDLHHFTVSGPPGWFLLEASRLPGQALLRGSYISLSPLGTADPLGPGVADPCQEHSRPSSLCCSSLTSSRSLTPTSVFFSASVAASQYGVSPCVSYRGAAGFGFRSLISTAIVCVHYEQKNHER